MVTETLKNTESKLFSKDSHQQKESTTILSMQWTCIHELKIHTNI